MSNDKALVEYLRTLGDRRFDRIFKGKELEDFYEFLKKQGLPHRRFVLTYPLLEDSYAWWFYKIKNFKTENKRISFELESPEVYIPVTEGSREPPEAWKGYPVWRLK